MLSTPLAAVGGVALSSISAGTWGFCGVRASDRQVICWGENLGGHVGVPPYSVASTPNAVSGVIVGGGGYLDTTAPAGALSASVSASDATSIYHVALTASPATSAGPTAAYTVKACAAACGDFSTSDPGNRGAGAAGSLPAGTVVQWQRTASDDSTDAFVNIDGGIGTTYHDRLAPSDASARYYRAIITQPGGTPTVSTNTDRGMRATDDVASSYNMNCRVAEDGRLTCWYQNSPSAVTFVPLADATVGVVDLTGDIFTGYVFGVLADGRGFVLTGTGPGAQVAAPEPIRQISATASFPCALLQSGSVTCGTSPTVINTYVTNLNNAVEISTGLNHACARRADSTVACFGTPRQLSSSATYGQMGDGTTVIRNLTVTNPVRSSGADPSPLSNVIQLSSWQLGTCALLLDGTARCWGTDTWGALGGALSGMVPYPIYRLPPFPGVTIQSISAGLANTCLLLSDSTVACSGYTGGALQSVYSRARINGTASDLTGVRAVSRGYYLYNLTLMDGRTFVAGTNFGVSHQAMLPTTSASNPAISSRSHQIVSGGDYTCALDQHGVVRCWGRGGYLGRGDLVPVGDNETADGNARRVALGGPARELVALGSDRMCAILVDSTIRCFNRGSDGSSWFGDNEAPGAGAPFALPAGRVVAALASGTTSTTSDGDLLMITDDGSVYLGTSQIALPAGRTAVDLASNGSTHCVVLDDLTVRCWGTADAESGNGGTLHSAPDTGPVLMPAAQTGVLDIAVGNDATGVLGTDGHIYMWGSNVAGALGTGDSTVLGDDEVIDGTTHAASAVLDGSSYAHLAVGDGRHFCTSSGARTVCWGGNNATGSLGTGTVYSAGTVPGLDSVFDEVMLPNYFAYPSGDVVGIADSAGDNTCVIYADWRVKCWGPNDYGQLGLGHTLGPLGDDESAGSVGALRGW